MTLFVHAVNVHSGGGGVLLNALINNTVDNHKVVFHLDERFSFYDEITHKVRCKKFKPTIFARLLAEYTLWRRAGQQDRVICFGNLPPLFKLKSHTILFLQNRYLLESLDSYALPLKLKIRLLLERFWLNSFCRNVDEIIVQTPSMEKQVKKTVFKNLPIKVMAFAESDVKDLPPRFKMKGKSTDEPVFIYVASGEPHKNHKNLIEAWCLLAENECRPTLKLTLDFEKNKTLINWICEKSIAHDLKVINLGNLSRSQLKKEYEDSDVLIYPSLVESLGLPLVEASQIGMSIIASELDYVRDLIDPNESFDPQSEVSIFRAVGRFLSKNAEHVSIITANDFLKSISDS